jgi:serine/threonine protein kinase
MSTPDHDFQAEPALEGNSRPSDSEVADLLGLATDTAEFGEPEWQTETLEVGDLAQSGRGTRGELGVGSRIGPFELLSLLGEGGFGRVWRAQQRQPLVREVALKVVKRGMDSEEVIARFAGERQALALMDHPNIARVLDAGTTEGGQPWFAMELVAGVPLTEFCDQQRLDLRQRLELFIGVCQAVHHAHQKGVLHRDLKPSNILVEWVDNRPLPKVIDFGIAKALDSADKAAVGLSLLRTTGLSMIGTPHYMSPEQVGYRGLDVDSRSDIYSLGVLLYELITGSTPLAAMGTSKTTTDELLRLIRERDFPKLSRSLPTQASQLEALAHARQTDARRLRGQLRGELEWLLAKALEKDREHRYNSAAALAEDIQRYLNNEAISAGPPGTLYRLRKLARRNRAALFSLGLVLSALFVGLGFAVWQAVRATEAERKAQARLQEAEASRDASVNLLVGNLVTLRDQLIPLGRADIMDKVLSSVETYFDSLPDVLHDTDISQQKILLDLNRCAVALARGDTAYAQRSLDLALDIIRKLKSTGSLSEPVAKEFIFIALVFTTELGRLEERDRARVYVQEVSELCDYWLQQDPESVWALGGLVHAAAILSFSAAMFEGELQLAMEHIGQLSRHQTRLQELAPESVEAQRASAYAALAQAFVVSSSRMSRALAVRLFRNAAEQFDKLYQTDIHTPWRDYYLNMKARSLAAAAWRLVEMGAESSNADQLNEGRELMLQVLAQRLQAVEQHSERADLWQDVVMSSKHLMVLVRVSSDAKDVENLKKLVLQYLTDAAARPMTAAAVNRAAQSLREWISHEITSRSPRVVEMTRATLLGIEVASRSLSEEVIHPSLILPWTIFFDTLRWLAMQEKMDAAAVLGELEAVIGGISAQSLPEKREATRSFLVAQLRLAEAWIRWHCLDNRAVEPTATSLIDAMRAMREAPRLGVAEKLIGVQMQLMLGEMVRLWFKRVRSESQSRLTVELAGKVAAEINGLVLALDAAAESREAHSSDALLAWSGWHIVIANESNLAAALVAPAFERMEALLDLATSLEAEGRTLDLAMSTLLSLLDKMARSAEQNGDLEVATRHWTAIIKRRQGMSTQSAWHFHHWASALHHRALLDWGADRKSQAIKDWKEAEALVTKSIRLNRNDASAAALHFQVRVMLQVAPENLKKLTDQTLSRLVQDFQALVEQDPGLPKNAILKAWDLLTEHLQSQGHPVATQSIALRPTISADLR